jgi:hypothetical protein
MLRIQGGIFPHFYSLTLLIRSVVGRLTRHEFLMPPKQERKILNY